MQACSVLHVAHVLVGVRRVTVVIVHIGHEDVVVVIQFCVAIFAVIFCITRCSLYISLAFLPIVFQSPGNDLARMSAVSRQ